MPGFDSNRFVNVPESLAQNLICCICLNIFDSAVISGCGHTFCKECVEEWIKDENNECPECRKSFRRALSQSNTEQSLVILNGFEFIRDFKINTIISKLKIKCNYETNGCQQEIEFGLLSAHLNNCEHRLCKTCGITLGNIDNHNCINLLLETINQLNIDLSSIKIEKIKTEDKLVEIDSKNSKLQKEIEELKLKLTKGRYSFITNVIEFGSKIETKYVLFGTYLEENVEISLYSDKINFFFDNSSVVLFFINLKTIEKLIICSSWNMLSFKFYRQYSFFHKLVKKKLNSNSSKANFSYHSDDLNEVYLSISFSSEIIKNFVVSKINDYFIDELRKPEIVHQDKGRFDQ